MAPSPPAAIAAIPAPFVLFSPARVSELCAPSVCSGCDWGCGGGKDDGASWGAGRDALCAPPPPGGWEGPVGPFAAAATAAAMAGTGAAPGAAMRITAEQRSHVQGDGLVSDTGPPETLPDAMTISANGVSDLLPLNMIVSGRAPTRHTAIPMARTSYGWTWPGLRRSTCVRLTPFNLPARMHSCT